MRQVSWYCDGLKDDVNNNVLFLDMKCCMTSGVILRLFNKLRLLYTMTVPLFNFSLDGKIK